MSKLTVGLYCHYSSYSTGIVAGEKSHAFYFTNSAHAARYALLVAALPPGTATR